MSDSYSDWSDDSRESSEEKGRRVAATMWVCFALIAIIALIVAVVVSIFGWPWNWKTSKHTIKHYRLPRNLKPESYDLVIKTYLPAYKDVPKSRELSFDGQMAILIEASSSTDRIALHMKHISIIKSESSVIFGDTVIPIKKISFLKSADVGIFHLAKNVIKGQKFMLRITYIGTIGIDRMTGLYLTNYTEDGEKKVAAVTKFEPTHAREMMPCFDEPDFKATWNIAVIHPYKTTAISNGMELSSEVDSDRSWVTTKFETTPRMSSYLVAVFVSEFTSNHLETSSGVLFRVWSRPAATDMTSYALSTGVKCLAFFEKYFDIPFSLKKQDMIAVPDFQSGAMENWGMITYRESYLLYDERIFPHSSRFRVTKTIAHELSHSWFGNLVTMKWWNDLWLNEGFARYMEHLAASGIVRGSRMKDLFLIDVLDSALQSDARAASQPLSIKAEETADIEEGFGTLVYDKGASLIYMIAALMGEEKFKKGLQTD